MESRTQSSIRPSPAANSSLTTGCCARFDPTVWNEREVTWERRLFVKQRVHSFLHVPIDMGRKVTQSMRLIERAHAKPAMGLMLADERSPWASDLYIDVLGPVPGAEMATLSGTFLTKVYEGPFHDVPSWIEDMQRWVASKGRTSSKLFIGYTTCPRCAKAYGKNYVVLFAQVDRH